VVGGQLEHGGLGAYVDTTRMVIGTENEQSLRELVEGGNKVGRRERVLLTTTTCSDIIVLVNLYGPFCVSYNSASGVGLRID